MVAISCNEMQTPRLTRKQEQAIAALLAEPTLAAAAQAAGVNESTLWRWFQSPAFADAYRLARREAMAYAMARIQAALSEAVDTLRAVMADDDAPAGSKVSAARTVIDTAVKVAEIEDLEARVRLLEARIDQRH